MTRSLVVFGCACVFACGGGLPGGADGGDDATTGSDGPIEAASEAGADATTDNDGGGTDSGLDAPPMVDTGVSPSQPWAVQVSATAWLFSITADSQQNVIIGGSNGTNHDFYIEKLDSMGNMKWKKQITSSGMGLHAIFGMVTDPQNNIYAVGTTIEGIDVGGGPLGIGHFLIKFDPTGSVIWQRSIPGRSESTWTLRGIALKSNGNVVVGGSYTGSVNLGGGTITSSGDDALLFEVTSSNAYVRAKTFGNSAAIRSVAVDKNDNVYFSTNFAGTVDFGGGGLQGPMIGSGARNIAVVKMDPSFAHIASREMKTTTADGTGLALDSAAHVALTGTFGTSVDLGGGTLVGQGGGDIFVGMLDSSLNHVWSKRFGDANIQSANGVAFDPNGNVTLVGSYSGSLNFGKGPLPTAVSGTGLYLAQFNGAGAFLSSFSVFQSGKTCTADGLAYLSQPDWAIFGGFDTCPFPSNTLMGGSGYVARVSP